MSASCGVCGHPVCTVSRPDCCILLFPFVSEISVITTSTRTRTRTTSITIMVTNTVTISTTITNIITITITISSHSYNHIITTATTTGPIHPRLSPMLSIASAVCSLHRRQKKFTTAMTTLSSTRLWKAVPGKNGVVRVLETHAVFPLA